MFFVLSNFSYCSIANQLSILILDNIKTQYDVIDLVQMQKFVINEFAKRHHQQHQLIIRNQEEGNNQPVRRYQIDHNNMQSAQVNQITIQLKDSIQSIQQFFKSDEEQLNQILGPNHVKYQDIISEQDIEFWKYLCNKDFKRLQKLLNQALGEGVFFYDSESDDSDDNQGQKVHGSDSEDDEDQMRMQGRNKLQKRRKDVSNDLNNDAYDEEEDFDHDGFMEQMLADMH